MSEPTWSGHGWSVTTIETESLGNRSYVITTATGAIAVDPPRDIDRVERVIAESGVDLVLVVETHRHADYLSGGLVLARRRGAEYAVPPGDPEPDFAYTAALPGQPLAAAGVSLRPVATPGHTPHHVSYVLVVDGAEVAVFTGGSMLYGAVGRTDLLSPDLTEPLAHDQWRSVRGLGTDLAEQVEVMPTHGFGSFCSATPTTGDADTSTIGKERTVNPALTQDEADFVTTMLAGYDTFPAYYARMPQLNADGPGDVDVTDSPAVDTDRIREALTGQTWVIDVRPKEDWMDRHLAGTASFALGSSLQVYFPWVAPADAEIILLAATAADIVQARRELARVGFDTVVGAWVGDVEDLAAAGELTSLGQHHFGELSARLRERPDTPVVDIRRIGEWRQSHLDSAVHVPYEELPQRMSQVPDGAWVHCATGTRAVTAAGLLERAGTTINVVVDDFVDAADAGLALATP